MTLVLFVLGLLGTLVLSASDLSKAVRENFTFTLVLESLFRGGSEDIIENATVGTVREKCTVGNERSGCGES